MDENPGRAGADTHFLVSALPKGRLLLPPPRIEGGTCRAQGKGKMFRSFIG